MNGEDEAYNRGKAEGYEEGKEDGRREAIDEIEDWVDSLHAKLLKMS